MVTVAQSAANLRNTHTHMDRTHSLMHLHQPSYNHVVRSASSAIFSACWVFSCFRIPPNSDMGYRVFIVHTWSFLCVCVQTGVGHTDSESVQWVLMGLESSSFGSESNAVPIEPPRHPVQYNNNNNHLFFRLRCADCVRSFAWTSFRGSASTWSWICSGGGPTSSLCEYTSLSGVCRPDMTDEVDWALKNNYLSIADVLFLGTLFLFSACF